MSSARDLNTVHVLMVEDEPTNVQVTIAMLSIMGILHVFACPSGRDLAATLERMARVDLVLLDLRLPGEDGYAILPRLRADARLNGVPIAAMTAQVMPDDVARAEAAGFDGFLAKPLHFDRFPSNIRRLLNGERVWEVR